MTTWCWSASTTTWSSRRTCSTDRLPAKYADLAPQFITNDDGTNVWLYEGQTVANVALNAVAGRPREEYGIEPTSFDQLRPGSLRPSTSG